MANIEEKIENLVKQKIEDLGYELYDVLLDNANYIKDQYFLEVSSTGVEKILRKDKHLKDNIGKEVQISLFKQIDILGKKQKEIIGILKEFDENNIMLQLDKEEISIKRKDISQIKTVFDWNSLN